MRNVVYHRTDERGNELRVYQDHELTPHILELCLFIRSERKERKLGIVNKKARALAITRDRNKHLHFKSNSYGFNYMLLNEAQTFDVVLIRDEIGTYKVPRHILLRNGEYLYFKQKGFEKQIFVPLSIIETFSIQEKLF